MKPSDTSLFHAYELAKFIKTIKNNLTKKLYGFYRYSKCNDITKKQIDDFISIIIDNINHNYNKNGVYQDTYLYIYNEYINFPNIIMDYDEISFTNKYIIHKEIPNIFKSDVYYELNKSVINVDDELHTLYEVVTDFETYYVELKTFDKLRYWWYRNFNLTNVVALSTFIGSVIAILTYYFK
jgi:hypothetical protein